MNDSWLVRVPIAHRGLHGKDKPENTLAAFDAAIEKNYAIELDIRAIDDGTVIVFHDDKLSRLTGRDGYASNLKKSDLKNIKILETEHSIPTFSEVLEAVGGRVPLLIEIKNSSKVGAPEQNVLKALEGYKGEFAIQSFNPYSVEFFYKRAPHIVRGQLASFFSNQKINIFKKFVLKRLFYTKFNKPHFISYNTENLPNKYVKRYPDLPVLAWTVRTQEEYQRVKPHCSNIIFENFIPE